MLVTNKESGQARIIVNPVFITSAFCINNNYKYLLPPPVTVKKLANLDLLAFKP